MQADVDDAINDGILFIGAAGNSDFVMDIQGGPDYDNTIAYSGNQQNTNRGAYPTALGGVICVGAISSSIAEQKADFSNSGPRVDVYSPGEQISLLCFQVVLVIVEIIVIDYRSILAPMWHLQMSLV